MVGLSIISALSRLSLQALPHSKTFGRSICISSALLFKTSPCLFGEPLKKKKRLDPAIIKAREERRKKKIEKQIRRLEKSARQLKPIDECETPLTLIDSHKECKRPLELSEGVMEQRILLEKQWAKYKHQQHLADVQMLDRISYSQQKALDELRKESEELYQEAIQIDPMLLPFKTEGPVNTPPIQNYEVPDGDYQDISKKWS